MLLPLLLLALRRIESKGVNRGVGCVKELWMCEVALEV